MKILPHINRYKLAKATVLTHKAGNKLLRQLAIGQICRNEYADRIVSSAIIASSIIPKIITKPHSIVTNEEATKTITIKIAQKTTNTASKKVQNITGVLLDKKIMLKGKIEDAPRLNILFNSLLLKNDNKKNPLNNKGNVFISSARKHGVDPQVLMAIALHESRRGTSAATLEKRNIGGITTSKGKLKHFSNINLCIDQMAEILAFHHRKDNINTVKELAKAGKYCEKSSAKEWIKNVMYYINELQGRNNI